VVAWADHHGGIPAAVLPGFGAGEGWLSEASKRFFLKKEAKTFANLSKSFLVLFCKKELLS
jgi:hypothetical protein